MNTNAPFHALTTLFAIPAGPEIPATPQYGLRYGNRVANRQALRERPPRAKPEVRPACTAGGCTG